MVLRVSAARTPTLTLPLGASLPLARAFVVEKEGWLRRQLAASSTPRLGPGSRLPFRGGEVTLVARGAGPTFLQDGRLYVAGPERETAVLAAAYLRNAARERCLSAVERHAARLGRAFGRLAMRDPRGRWGSCSSDGNLMFSWRLILAPDPVLDYVAAHEVAHLAYMDHSPRFWAVVAQLCGDPTEHRAWLRRHGSELMTLRFS
jgi:hypothetical protein